MANTDIENLFDNDRLPGGLGLLVFFLYFPLGVILLLIRVFIGLQTFLIACILPKMSSLRSFILRALCGLLGILVSKEGMEHQDKNVKVLVANYTTTLDHLAVDLVLSSCLASVWDLPPALMWMLGYLDLGAKQGRETLINNARSHTAASKIPLLVFPEGASTNGRVGLLKFSVWPFSLEQPVQPLVIKVSRPAFVRVAPSVLGGRWWIDVLWFLFVPYTLFHIRVLPVRRQAEEESVNDFSRRVQYYIASEMGLQPTTYTSADKVEYAKRKLHLQPAAATPGSSTSSSPDGSIEVMTHQVRDVLPHVPLSVIRRDLALTKDVDLTISNLLEGRVEYTAEEPPISASSSSSSSPAASPSSSQSKLPNTGMSFWRDASHRQLSLEERKQQLLATARRRYMEKHGML